MKNFKTALVVFIAALLPLALLATPSSAVIGQPDLPTKGELYQERSASDHTRLTPPFTEGQQFTLVANFPDGVKTVTFYRDTGSGYQSLGSSTSSASGIAKRTYTVLSGNQDIFAEATGDLDTEVDNINVTPTPSSTTAVLDAPSSDGKTWTAHFGDPDVPGKATQLQIQQIYTDEVSDVDAVNPADSKTKKMGEWKTIATSTQNANGDSTFNLSSPYPYRVAHKYRAVSGTAKSCDPVSATDANPPLCQTFGLTQTTPKATGLSAVYFNSNEGHAIDTRERYYEGEFEMTADPEVGCSAIPKMKFSTMKGRGNYSWSFKRKSYTLKLGSKTDLCGMGKSKKYALVSQDYDKSFLRNPLAQYIGSKFSNLAWTPESRPVDFYLNGKYLGHYMLIERIAIQGSVENAEQDDTLSNRVDIHELNGDDPDEQVDPGKTGGYILEWDFRKGADYNVSLGSDSGWVGVKEPENDVGREGPTDEGISSAHKSYINSYLNSADNAMRRDSCQSSDYEDFIDKASAVDYYIAMEYMKPVDGNMWASVYMYKPRNGKLFFGPLWDFDLAAGSATRAGNVASSSGFYLKNNQGISAQQSSNTWFNCLNKRSSFRNAVAARWDAVKSSIQPGSFIDTQKAIIKSSAETSFSNAPNGASHSYRISNYQVIKSNFDADVSHLRSWAVNRKSWLDGSSGF